MAEIEALLDWRNRILKPFFFQGPPPEPLDAQAPSTILMWCKREFERGAIDKALSEPFFQTYDLLSRAAKKIIDNCGKKAPPEAQIYDDFEKQFKSFIDHIRILRRDSSDALMAVDPVTGLRTMASLRHDIKREQDRLDRKGDSYSLSHVGIDNMQDIEQKLDVRGQDAVLAHVGQIFARTLRSFDDAYYMGNGEYMIVLKHIEFMDACAVIDRMRKELDATQAVLPNNEKFHVTASFGVAEALPREGIEAVLTNVKQALDEAKQNGGNTVAEFHEVSMLERYARDHGKEE